MFRLTSAILAALAVAIFLNGVLDMFAAAQGIVVQSVPRAVVVGGPALLVFMGSLISRKGYVL